jgi:hypothetical protein
MTTRAILDPLFLTTLIGSLTLVWFFVRLLVDDLDLESEPQETDDPVHPLKPRRESGEGGQSASRTSPETPRRAA